MGTTAHPLTNASMDPKEIKRARHALGITQREAARRIGCSERTYVRWETGEKPPRPYHYGSICEGLQMEQPARLLVYMPPPPTDWNH